MSFSFLSATGSAVPEPNMETSFPAMCRMIREETEARAAQSDSVTWRNQGSTFCYGSVYRGNRCYWPGPVEKKKLGLPPLIETKKAHLVNRSGLPGAVSQRGSGFVNPGRIDPLPLKRTRCIPRHHQIQGPGTS
jgi:hypothetical protein